MKPGMSKNLANPSESEAQGISAAMSVGMGSNQTPMTAQYGDKNPRRCSPPQSPAGPSGRADVDPSGVLDGQTSDYSASTRKNYANRKRMLG